MTEEKFKKLVKLSLSQYHGDKHDDLIDSLETRIEKDITGYGICLRFDIYFVANIHDNTLEINTNLIQSHQYKMDNGFDKTWVGNTEIDYDYLYESDLPTLEKILREIKFNDVLN